MTPFILILLAATVARFIIGAIWYMPKGLFGKKWLALQGAAPDFKPEKAGGIWMLWGFLITLVSTFVLMNFIANYADSMGRAMLVAFLLWLGFVVPILAQRMLYNLKKDYTWGLFLIDASHELVALLVATLVTMAFIG
jgi:hypothetical protein